MFQTKFAYEVKNLKFTTKSIVISVLHRQPKMKLPGFSPSKGSKKSNKKQGKGGDTKNAQGKHKGGLNLDSARRGLNATLQATGYDVCVVRMRACLLVMLDVQILIHHHQTNSSLPGCFNFYVL